MKKKNVVIIFSVISIVVLVVGFIFINNLLLSPNDASSNVVGGMYDNEITESNLTSDSKYKYTFFVINDREGKLNVSDKEFETCKKMCEEKNMNFFYIGKQYLSHLEKFGFYDSLYADDLCGIGYVITPTGYATIQGLWTTTEEERYPDNPRLLGQILAYTFVDDVIKMMN